MYDYVRCTVSGVVLDRRYVTFFHPAGAMERGLNTEHYNVLYYNALWCSPGHPGHEDWGGSVASGRIWFPARTCLEPCSTRKLTLEVRHVNTS